MSHQTGIRASENLTNILKQAKCGNFRAVKIIIANEKLELAETLPSKGTLEQDYSNDVKRLLNDSSCCYLLVREDAKTTKNEFKWIMILFTPDKAAVKDKMLYAATKASFKTFFGDDLISHELHGTVVSDVDYNGFQKHIASLKAAPPLTDSEKIKAEIKANEVHRSLNDKAETLRGVCFPVDNAVLDAFSKLHSDSINYVELVVDSNEELIKLGSAKKCSINELSKFQSKDPRYHVIKYKYVHNGSSTSALVFVYTMPGYSCAIKDRMMYSSCKGPLIEFLEKKYGKIDKKIEEENLSTITDKYLYDELHPPEVAERAAFVKPKRPGR